MTIRKLRSRDAYLEWAALGPSPAALSGNDRRVSFLLEFEVNLTLEMDPLFKAIGLPPRPEDSNLLPDYFLRGEYVSAGFNPFPIHLQKRIVSITMPLTRLKELRDNELFLNVPFEYSTERWAPPADAFEARLAGALVSPTRPSKLTGKVVVVIDDGLAFLNRCFRQSVLHESRVMWFWDQDPSKVVLGNGKELHLREDGSIDKEIEFSPWQFVSNFGYGRELPRDTIDELLVEIEDGRQTEEGAYADLYYDKHVRFAMAHGTHVADLACGSTHPRDVQLPEGVTDAAGADDTQIIMVQLPPKTVVDTSGGGLAKHVLDAMKYALSKIENGADVVVNLSYGATGGPHDGNTLFERALDATCAQARENLRNFALVLPGGNHFDASGHGSAVLAQGEYVELTLQVRAEDPTETFCELWFQKTACEADIEIEVDDIEIEVGKPGQVGSITSQAGFTVFDALAPETSCCAVSLLANAAASPERCMALVSLMPVVNAGRDTTGAPSAPEGRWTIRIRNKGPLSFEVDAWVQRDEAIPHSRFPARQAMLLSSRPLQRDTVDDSPVDTVKRRGTGSNISNGIDPIVAGACYALSGRPSAYTAARLLPLGKRGQWPDLVAPGDLSEIMPGLLAAGSRSGVKVRMNGTSVSAALVSRAALNVFANLDVKLTRAELIDALIRIFGCSSTGKVGLAPIEKARLGAGWVYSHCNYK